MKPARLIGLLLMGAGISGLYLFWGEPSALILWQVRLPRMLLTLLTGMVLGGVGSVYQLMLANPLAEPYILGISSGSAFGSILMGVLELSLLMPLGGFAGAMLTMVLVWGLAGKGGSFEKGRLLIGGVIAGMFFASGISLLMYLFHEDTIIILGTLMGNLGRIFSFGEWRVFLGLSVIGVAILYWLYRQSTTLDLVSSGDIYAGSVGIDVAVLRKRVFVLSSILIGIVVSYAGIIGFVGLIVPHVARYYMGSSQKRVYPLSLFMGAFFLLACDLLSQHITVLELPVGVITAAIGCPFFMWLMLRGGKSARGTSF
ncbi:MAG TPA: iron ABC transporter permease [Candidatus Cloacimonadota bacterium]|nr:iron ABC transporter permease [Candidatus Cloacimonadota bacterium]